MSEPFDFVVRNFNGHTQYSIESTTSAPQRRYHSGKIIDNSLSIEKARVALSPRLQTLPLDTLAELYEAGSLKPSTGGMNGKDGR